MRRNRANKGQSGLAIVLILAAILVVAYFAVPAFQTWVQSLWNQYGPNTWTYSTVTLTYEDGTKRTVSSKDAGPFALIDVSTGKKVVSFSVELHVTPQFTGSVTGYRCQGNGGWALYNRDVTAKIADLGTMQPIDVSGGAITSGQDVLAFSGSISASTLEGLYTGWVAGTEYALVCVSTQQLTVTLTFSDTTTASKNAMPSYAAVRVRYEAAGSFTGLSVLWKIGIGY